MLVEWLSKKSPKLGTYNVCLIPLIISHTTLKSVEIENVLMEAIKVQ